ncbi:lamin tail domain-containing protein [Sphaerotilus montanus]|uniref:LTD domain-containing protein n=1 Tax=Sphaerotilus montanus TaxID=522889 RepID=A0A7Y9QVN5_9BURK|nr:lamin tail domain-containing protein [Sphaerotilus montanus]NYG31489.1 hypothetical protein [Sphaerotilus montanus]NZD58686.1 lamin tail domain-containing protein [Sphaerotilus montanus]
MASQRFPLTGLVAAVLALSSTFAQADVRITEVAPWSSGNSPVGADWFELTNTGASALDLTGWKVDDSSAAFASAVALSGLTSLAAGQSAVFVEGTTTTAATFVSTWFGASAPAGFAIGYYSGAGIGLSATADAVNIFNAAGVLQAGVTFGASDAVSPYQTFDNAAGLNGVTLTQLSVAGIQGAFVAMNSLTDIGSPGVVPEPESYALMLAGLGVLGLVARRQR